MKTLVNITENNWFEDIRKAVFYVYTGHGADGFLREGFTLTLERDNEQPKYITGLRWIDPSLPLTERNHIDNILLGYINNVNEIQGGRLYTSLLSTDKIYLNTPQ